MSSAVVSTAMSLQSLPPSAVLAPFIRSYGIRETTLGAAQLYIPLPARSDCFLEVYLGDRYRIVDVASGALHVAPRVVLVGPHTRRCEDLLLSGSIRVFSMRFTAVGFRALFGIPAHAVANAAESAELLLGPSILELAERLAGARTTSELVGVAERFFTARLPKLQSTPAPLAAIVRAMERRHGAVEIARLAAAGRLSVRHMEREFREHVGVSPKMFARLARLSHALDMAKRAMDENKACGPHWADVALAAGFYDQSHLVRDFRALTGETPAGFLALSQRPMSHLSNRLP